MRHMICDWVKIGGNWLYELKIEEIGNGDNEDLSIFRKIFVCTYICVYMCMYLYG